MTNLDFESPAETNEREAAQAGMLDTDSAFGAWGDVLFMDEQAEREAEGAWLAWAEAHPVAAFM